MKAAFSLGLSLILALSVSIVAYAQSWTSYTTSTSGLASDSVRAISVDDSNVKWFGTSNGLSRYDGASWTTYTTAQNLAHSSINAIVFESSSNGPELWIGTDGGVSVVGVSKTDAISAATPYTPDNTGLASLTVYTAAIDTGHVKWFGTDKGASTFSGEEWITYTIYDILSNNVVKTIAAAPDGWIYLGTDGGGVSRYDGVTAASPYDTSWSAIQSDTILSAFVDSKGTQWFGTDDGLSAHVGHDTRSDWTSYSTEDGLADKVILSIAEDTRGVMWFGTMKGVSSFDGEHWTTYTTADGLAGNIVNAIAVDRDGALWFGTESGVSRYGGVLSSVDSPGNPTLITIDGVYPNPFNPSATIRFTLPSEGYVTVAIHSLSGQKIRELESRRLSAGVHSVVWNGHDNTGKASASGVYLVRLTMGGITAAQQMTLIK